mgnify:CR=1 FL=1|tara:strand:+ start:182 stop:361 length:180 start_codon:yes stop_codon:yes gene_type:complete
MTFKNPYKHLLKNSIYSFKKIFETSNQNLLEKDRNLECLQFGICSNLNKVSKEIVYYHS